MAIADHTIDEFLRDVAEGKPTPGGGAVTAIGGAAGAALCEMACRISLDHDPTNRDQATLDELVAAFSEHRSKLLRLADDDVAAVRDALADSQNAGRDPRMLEVPLETAREGLAVLERSRTVAEVGFAPAVGDVGTGALFAHACCRAALQNVRINLGSADESFNRAEIGAEVERIEQTADETLALVRKTVMERS